VLHAGLRVVTVVGELRIKPLMQRMNHGCVVGMVRNACPSGYVTIRNHKAVGTRTQCC
jgi:hypothetical protein